MDEFPEVPFLLDRLTLLDRDVALAVQRLERLRARRGVMLLALQAAGLSYGQIAARTGLSRSRVQQLIERARDG